MIKDSVHYGNAWTNVNVLTLMSRMDAIEFYPALMPVTSATSVWTKMNATMSAKNSGTWCKIARANAPCLLEAMPLTYVLHAHLKGWGLTARTLPHSVSVRRDAVITRTQSEDSKLV